MLELSTTAGYALLALGYLERTRDRWVLAREIAQHTGVAGPYLSRILYNLVKAGMVLAKRGYRGGFRLSRPGDQIAVLDIVDAVEQQARVQRCLLGLAECSDQTGCPVHLLWKTTRSRVEASLARLTLVQVADAVAERDSRPSAAAPPRSATARGRQVARCPATQPSPARRKRKKAVGARQP